MNPGEDKIRRGLEEWSDEEKTRAEAKISGKAGTVSVPLMITRSMRQQILDLGYSRENINEMTPELANEIIKKQKTGVSQKSENGKSENVAEREKLVAEAEALEAEKKESVEKRQPAERTLEIGIEKIKAGLKQIIQYGEVARANKDKVKFAYYKNARKGLEEKLAQLEGKDTPQTSELVKEGGKEKIYYEPGDVVELEVTQTKRVKKKEKETPQTPETVKVDNFLAQKEEENKQKIESAGEHKTLLQKSVEGWKNLDNSTWGRTAKVAANAAIIGAGVLWTAHTLDINTGSNMAMSLAMRAGLAGSINALLTRIKIPSEKQKIVKGALLGAGLGASFMMGGWVALGIGGVGIGARMLSDKYFKNKTGQTNKISKNVVETLIALGVGVGTYAGLSYEAGVGTETEKIEPPSVDKSIGQPSEHVPVPGVFDDKSEAIKHAFDQPTEIEPAEPVVEFNPDPDAIVGKGEGIEHALQRQGLSGPEAHLLAMKMGYIDDAGNEVRVAVADKVAYIVNKDVNGDMTVEERFLNKDGTWESRETHTEGTKFEGKDIEKQYEYLRGGQQTESVPPATEPQPEVTPKPEITPTEPVEETIFAGPDWEEIKDDKFAEFFRRGVNEELTDPEQQEIFNRLREAYLAGYDNGGPSLETLSPQSVEEAVKILNVSDVLKEIPAEDSINIPDKQTPEDIFNQPVEKPEISGQELNQLIKIHHDNIVNENFTKSGLFGSKDGVETREWIKLSQTSAEDFWKNGMENKLSNREQAFFEDFRPLAQQAHQADSSLPYPDASVGNVNTFFNRVLEILIKNNLIKN